MSPRPDDRSREEHLEALVENGDVSEDVRAMADKALEILREGDQDDSPEGSA
jgi:hypothetical protein